MAIDLGYTGSSVIVTGGTRGIGRATVEILLREGANVLAVGSRSETAKALRAEIENANLAVVVQDMRADDCGAVIAGRATEEFGEIGLVVNNAAAFDYIADGRPERSQWLELFKLKTLGYWSLVDASAHWLEKQHGAVVNVAGIAGVIASPASPHVAAVNAAIVSMTEAMASAFAPRHIRVNAVSPGATDTDRFATRASMTATENEISVEAARKALSSRIPLGHPASPAEVALVIALLGAPALRAVTGSHLIIDGGSTLGGRRRA